MIKNFKKILTAAFVLLIFFSLWYKNGSGGKTYESTEFLFDTLCRISASGKNSEAAAKAAFEKIEEINALTDFYSQNSEVSKFNAAKSGEKVKISAETAEILDKMLEISRETGGAFDPTVAPLSELWNFKEAKKPPEEEAVLKALEKVDYRKISLDKKNLTAEKSEDGIKIDMGASAKGYACDKAAEILRKYNVSGIIDLGGNIGCVGKNPKEADGRYTVGLQTPFEPLGTYEKTVAVSEKAVVTCGVYQRFFEYNGKKYHHILDLKTGFPKEEDYNAVTVVSSSSLEADCLSTACFVLGREKGNALAEKHGAEIYFY